MKALVVAISLILTGIAGAQAPESPAPAKYKVVCRENKESKIDCKKIRIHKKLDGKAVPPK